MTALLEIEGLTGGYNGTDVLFDISIKIQTCSIVGVLGRNGVGKTTLARLTQGGLKATRGEIRFDGYSIGHHAAHARRRKGIGYMPQTAMVFDDLTVQENLLLGTNSQSTDRYFDMFPRLGERLKQPAGTMSGGERKILSFVRTMIEDTKLIILDEPTEGVQSENIKHMADCLRERVSDGASILLCEQNLNLLSDVSNWFIGLDSGRIKMTGSAGKMTREDLNSFLHL